MRLIRTIVSKISAILLVSLALFCVWNAKTVTGVAAPQIRAAIAGISAATPPPASSYDPSLSRFYFPRLVIEAPLSVSANTSPLQSKDWNAIKKDLEKGVSLNFSGQTLDGTRLAYITGHSSDSTPHEYSSVFAALYQAKTGDIFSFSDGSKTRTYNVISKRIVDATDAPGFSAEALTPSGTDGHYVALVTCWPLLTDWRRMVVVGELVG